MMGEFCDIPPIAIWIYFMNYHPEVVLKTPMKGQLMKILSNALNLYCQLLKSKQKYCSIRHKYWVYLRI